MEPHETRPHNAMRTLFALVFTQMSASAGIKKFGEVAEEALRTEFRQLRDLEVFTPLLASSLTEEQKREAMVAITLDDIGP